MNAYNSRKQPSHVNGNAQPTEGVTRQRSTKQIGQ